jgi:predicted GH43/DUF377 family glycosyl hydrolase
MKIYIFIASNVVFLCTILCFNPTVAQTNLTAYVNNPVIPYGSSGSWDSGVVYLPDVVKKNNVYYLFYSGSSNLMTTPFAIGYATSTDGYNWTKNAANPVFEADGSGFDAFQVGEGRIIIEDSLWILYYGARSAGGPGPGPSIGRATSTSPDGPWNRLNDPILTTGISGEWDGAFITPRTILHVDSGYMMYYSGGTGFPFPPNNYAMVGLALSSDGINWTKHDDPQTTDPPYAESDPVLQLGMAGSYDSGLAWECDVLKTDNGFEMFYTSDPDSWAGERICYATSMDGVNWEKDDLNNPILSLTQNWATLDLVAPSAIKIDDEYFVYYIGNTTLFNGQIGLATSPVVSALEENFDGGVASEYKLLQNYPNPFNPSTKIDFVIPGNTFEDIKIVVYDFLGKEVRVLLNEKLSPGNYSVNWDGMNENGEMTASGIYFYRLSSFSYSESRKMILLR